MSRDYVSKHSKPESETARRRASARRKEEDYENYGERTPVRSAQSGNRKKRKEKKSAGIVVVLLLLILVAAGILVYLAVNVFGINIPFLSSKAGSTQTETVMTPAPVVEATPKPTPEPTPEPTPVPQETYVYTADSKVLDNGGNYVSAGAWSSNGFYAMSWDIADDGYTYVYRISNVDAQGTVKTLSSYKTMDGLSNKDNWSNFFSSAELTAVSADEEGKPVALECVTSSGEKTEGETTETLFSAKLFARKLDTNGAEISSTELVFSDSVSDTAAKAFRINADGNYILLTEKGAAVFSPDGTMIGSADSGSYTDSMVLLQDGRAGIVTWGSDGQKMNALAKDGSVFEDSWTLPDSACAFADGAGEYAFFYSDGVELYGYNTDTGVASEILNWSQSDISGIRVSSLVSPDGENYICITNQPDETGSYTSSLVNLTRTVKDTAAQRTELVLASVYPMETLQDAVAEYNRNSTGARVLLKSFEMGETEEETLDALKMFVQDELDGNMPDLIDMTGMPYEEMAAAGMLEDLYQYMDADSALSRDQILPQVLSALEINGKLYATCSGFSISTAIGKKSVIGDQTGWTFDQYSSITNTMGEGVSVFDGSTVRSTVLYEELGINSETFINWNDMTCDFNNEQFTKLLAFVKSVPADYAEDPDSISIEKGNQFLERTTLFSYDDIILAAENFNQNEVYIGFPSVNGTGNGLNLYKDFAMSATCADKQAAWQFLRTYFTEEYQTGADIWYFPSNSNAFATGLAAAKQVQTDESGNNVVRATLLQEGKDPQYYYQLTDTMAAQVQSIVDHACGSSCSEAIYDLVEQNADGYLNGEDSAASAAEAVQNEVSAYLAGLKQ